MKDFKENGRVIEITLDNDKIVKVSTEYIKKNMKILDTDMEDAIYIWLEDEGYLENEEQNELCNQAKENKSNKIIGAKTEKDPKKKTQKERVKKDNPTKEMIITEIAKILPNFATNINIENAGKLITFTIGNNDFKIDLVQKRKPKAQK